MITREILWKDSTLTVEFDLNRMEALLDGHSYPFDWESTGHGVYHMRTGSQNYRVSIISYHPPDQLLFQINGNIYEAVVRDEQQQLLKKMGLSNVPDSGTTELKAPMPGKVLEIPVSVGDEITTGQPLIILEAMKMENELHSVHPGRIKSILIKPGVSVEKHELLMTITRM